MNILIILDDHDIKSYLEQCRCKYDPLIEISEFRLSFIETENEISTKLKSEHDFFVDPIDNSRQNCDLLPVFETVILGEQILLSDIMTTFILTNKITISKPFTQTCGNYDTLPFQVKITNRVFFSCVVVEYEKMLNLNETEKENSFLNQMWIEETEFRDPTIRNLRGIKYFGKHSSPSNLFSVLLIIVGKFPLSILTMKMA